MTARQARRRVEPTEWVVEGCIAPGDRRMVWMGKATSGRNALLKAHTACDGNGWHHFWAMPNYVATGRLWPVVKDPKQDPRHGR